MTFSKSDRGISQRSKMSSEDNQKKEKITGNDFPFILHSFAYPSASDNFNSLYPSIRTAFIISKPDLRNPVINLLSHGFQVQRGHAYRSCCLFYIATISRMESVVIVKEEKCKIPGMVEKVIN
jgi:hypothetical protein